VRPHARGSARREPKGVIERQGTVVEQRQGWIAAKTHDLSRVARLRSIYLLIVPLTPDVPGTAHEVI
jgi:hypothetical protein